MASETVKVFKTDQEQEEDTLPEEVNHKYAMFSSMIFELFTTWFHEKRISNFYKAKVGCDQILNKKITCKEIF